MSSLKIKEGGNYTPPPPPKQSSWIPLVLVIAIVAVGAVGAFAKRAMDTRVTVLESEIVEMNEAYAQDIKRLQAGVVSNASDITVVTKRIGVTTDELNQSRQVAEKLRQEQERQAPPL